MLTPIISLAQLDPNGTYTYADYITWQFEELVELLRGKVVRRQSTPAEPHQATVGQLFGAIGGFLRQQPCLARLGPYDVRLPMPGTTIDTVVQPDICVICDPSKTEPSGCLGAPYFIVEVLSPGAMARDWRDKFSLYEEAGVGEYWIVSPQAQFIAAFVLDEATNRYQRVGEYAGPGPVPCATLPGLGLDWSDIFTELP